MKQAEYARHAGVSKGYVSRLVSRGMPLDSAEVADAWRGSYRRNGNGASGHPPPAPPPEPLPPSSPPPTGISEDGPRAAYQRASVAERAAFGVALAALRSKALDAGRTLSTHATALTNLVRAREAVLALEQKEGHLVPVAWIRKHLEEHDGVAATIVKSMPKTLAGRIAPQDPGFAEGELSRWVNETFLASLYATNPFTRENSNATS